MSKKTPKEHSSGGDLANAPKKLTYEELVSELNGTKIMLEKFKEYYSTAITDLKRQESLAIKFQKIVDVTLPSMQQKINAYKQTLSGIDKKHDAEKERIYDKARKAYKEIDNLKTQLFLNKLEVFNIKTSSGKTIDIVMEDMEKHYGKKTITEKERADFLQMRLEEEIKKNERVSNQEHEKLYEGPELEFNPNKIRLLNSIIDYLVFTAVTVSSALYLTHIKTVDLESRLSQKQEQFQELVLRYSDLERSNSLLAKDYAKAIKQDNLKFANFMKEKIIRKVTDIGFEPTDLTDGLDNKEKDRYFIRLNTFFEIVSEIEYEGVDSGEFSDLYEKLKYEGIESLNSLIGNFYTRKKECQELIDTYKDKDSFDQKETYEFLGCDPSYTGASNTINIIRKADELFDGLKKRRILDKKETVAYEYSLDKIKRLNNAQLYQKPEIYERMAKDRYNLEALQSALFFDIIKEETPNYAKKLERIIDEK